jgi:hypothetical protein
LTKTILITALIGALVSPTFAATKKPSPTRTWDVYVSGEYVGSDPDHLIRNQLRREASE